MANPESSSPTLASPNPRATHKHGSALITAESLDEAQQRRLAQRKHDDLVSEANKFIRKLEGS